MTGNGGVYFQGVELGDDLPDLCPDVSMAVIRRFTHEAAYMPAPRFIDHEEARKEGLPAAIVPGIMSQGIFAAAIHAWAPGAEVRKLDTIFRAPLVADTQVRVNGVVTDCDEEGKTIELDLTMTNEANETPVLGTALVALE